MFDPEKFTKQKVGELKKQIDGNAVIALSGGVDSTTAAVLVSKAIGDRLECIFVDTGLMRLGEKEYIRKLADDMGLRLKIIDAETQFLEALKGVTDPEMKRKIIGNLFIRIFEQNTDAEYLVQGTIAPDWIETGSGIREKIKTHHNVGGVPQDTRFKIIEPLRDLYKDEVRVLAKYLGLPRRVYERQPFPGPGLAVRIIGEVTKEKLEILKRVTAIVEEEVVKEFPVFEERPWQYFAVLLPVRSVGVRGDKRAYGYTVAVRLVDSVDGMTAAFYNVSYSFLMRLSTRITNEVPEVNRVVYDITNKPPGTIEWE